jgi:hypothetical protein
LRRGKKALLRERETPSCRKKEHIDYMQ